MMDNKLKPCPVCGGEAYVNGFAIREGIVSCDNCNTSVAAVNKSEAVLKWNRRASPWISVEERLPDFDYYVWIAYRFGAAEGVYRKSGLWFTRADFQELPGVTHWMPLPELPEEVDG